MEQASKQEAVSAIIREAIQVARATERTTNQVVLIGEEQAANRRRKKQEYQEDYQEAADFQAIFAAAERTNKWMGHSLAGSPLHIKTSMEKAIFNRYIKTLKQDPDDEYWDELAAVNKSLSDYAHVFPKLPFMLMNYYYTEWKGSQDLVLNKEDAKVESLFEKQFYPTLPYDSNLLGENEH